VTTAPPVTVIGVGNPYRRDDAAAREVLDLLAARYGDDSRVRLVELDGEPVRLVQAWEGSSTVVLVDAVRSGADAGTVHEVDAATVVRFPSSGVGIGGGHLLGLSEAVDLARALDRLPPTLHLIGVEGADFEYGVGLSATTADACARAAERVSTLVDDALEAG
jgi:hydrogenase maturation protease